MRMATSAARGTAKATIGGRCLAPAPVNCAGPDVVGVAVDSVGVSVSPVSVVGVAGVIGIVGQPGLTGRLGTAGLSGGLGKPGGLGTTTGGEVTTIVAVGTGGLGILSGDGKTGTVTVETDVVVTKTVDPVGGKGPHGVPGGPFGPGGVPIGGDE